MLSTRSRDQGASSASVIIIVVLLMSVVTSRGHSTVLTGEIIDLPESTGLFYWGDGIHDLFQQWSARVTDSSGWFYGSTYSGTSNADVYVYRQLTDPTTVTNAEVFPYTDVVDWAGEGDSVFFRGTNGYYGAWRIDSIDPLPGGPPYAELDGRWYFQDDGSGCFAADCGATAVEASTWGSIKALMGK